MERRNRIVRQQNIRQLRSLEAQGRQVEIQHGTYQPPPPIHFDPSKPFPALLSIVKNVPMCYLMNIKQAGSNAKTMDEYIRNIKPFSSKAFESKLPFKLSYYFKSYVIKLQFWFKMELRVRTRLRRLVQFWIIRKYKGRRLNIEDPSSMCVPDKPVEVFDTASRGVYVFDAENLKKHMESALGYARWMIPEPKLPTNPFTNLPFTYGQLNVLISGMRRNDVTSWMLEGFKSCKYNMTRFEHEFARPLRLYALKSLYRNPTSDDLVDEVRDFIEDEYEQQSIKKNAHLIAILWAVDHKYSSEYIADWRKVWYDYMEKKLLHGADYYQTHRRDELEIQKRTRMLFNKHEIIQTLAEERLGSMKPSQNTVLVLNRAQLLTHIVSGTNFVVDNPMHGHGDELLRALVEQLVGLHANEETEIEESSDSDSGLP